jgi:quercetin dioxygenase-like cupin family protein
MVRVGTTEGSFANTRDSWSECVAAAPREYIMAEHMDQPGHGQQNGFSGVTRKVLERLPLPGDQRELCVVEVTYPPGGVAPIHRHSVGGAIYIIEGVCESAYGGEVPRQYRAGDTLQGSPRHSTHPLPQL